MAKKQPAAAAPPTPSLRLEWRSPAELAENPRNWRRHPRQQLAALSDVIADVGWAGACLFNERTQRLIDGHARKHIGIAKKTDQIPVLVGNWTEEQEAKILATLDPIGAMAEADSAQLEALLREVGTGSAALQQLLDGLAVKAGVSFLQEGWTDPDDIPQPPDQATTQPGDLWLLGRHRLLCADSSQPGDVDRLLDGAAIHVVNTDPPYGVRLEPRSNNAIAAGLRSIAGTTHHQTLDVSRHPGKAKPTTRKLRAKDRPLANDFLSEAEFDKLLHAWFGSIARVLGPGRAFWLWGGFSNCGSFPPVLKAHGLHFSQAVIWVKEHPVLTHKDMMGNHEWCFYGWREGAAHQWFGPANATDVWSVKKVNPQHMIHLTEKPVELARRALEHSTRPGENVLDLFGGSGSTLIAAEQTGRTAFVMEIDALYCDVIVQRWEKFSGRQAQRRPAK